MSKEYVSSQFGEGSEQLWVNEFRGLLDGFHAFDLILGTDGNKAKGLYRFSNEGMIYELDGHKIENVFDLAEFDSNDNHTGFISLEMNSDHNIGFWTDTHKNGKIPLTVLKENDQLPSCNTQIWNLFYDGKSQGQLLDIHVAKMDNTYQISILQDGNLIDELLHTDYDNQFDLEINPEKLTDVNQLNLNIDEQGLSVKSKGKSLNTIDKYYLQESIRSICEDMINYRQRATVIYPTISNKNFDKKINEQVEVWKKEVKEYFSKSYFHDPADIAEDRLRDEAFIWYEIDAFSKEHISGNLYFQCSWSDVVKVYNFNFDNRKNKLIEPKKLLAKSVDFNLFCKSQSKNKDKYYKYINIDHRGIILRSEYDIYSGQEEKHIPFSEIRDRLNNKYFSKI